MSSTKVSLKLLVDNKSKRVLFAEAGKDFVDFLFNLLALPVGTVLRLLRKRSMVGSLANLYGSIEELSDTYLQSTYTKDSLLKPKVSASASQFPLLLADKDCYVKDTSNTTERVYMCSFYHKCSSSRLSTDPEDVCISCNRAMSREMTYADGQDEKEDKLSNVDGFVKGVVTYMVMDDLVVKPMSTISSIAMLTKFHIKDIGALEEKVVDLDMSQGLKLLKASLESKNVLTRVFL